MASILCRKGETFPNSHRHDSVAAVRACQVPDAPWQKSDRPTAYGDHEKPAPAADPRNVYLNPKGINAQLASVDVDKAVQMAEHLSQRPGMTLAKAEKQLAEFKPKCLRVDPALEDSVPDGRYALVRDGEVKFYRVRKVTKGPWAGRTFVDRQAGDETHPVRYANDRAKILREISADVKAAAIRYGRELGQCSQCGRALTNPESIALGIGPICLNKVS